MGDRKPAPITNSITQVDTKVLGDSPATPMGKLFAGTAEGLADAMVKPAPKPARAGKE